MQSRYYLPGRRPAEPCDMNLVLSENEPITPGDVMCAALVAYANPDAEVYRDENAEHAYINSSNPELTYQFDTFIESGRQSNLYLMLHDEYSPIYLAMAKADGEIDAHNFTDAYDWIQDNRAQMINDLNYLIVQNKADMEPSPEMLDLAEVCNKASGLSEVAIGSIAEGIATYYLDPMMKGEEPMMDYLMQYTDEVVRDEQLIEDIFTKASNYLSAQINSDHGIKPDAILIEDTFTNADPIENRRQELATVLCECKDRNIDLDDIQDMLTQAMNNANEQVIEMDQNPTNYLRDLKDSFKAVTQPVLDGLGYTKALDTRNLHADIDLV